MGASISTRNIRQTKKSSEPGKDVKLKNNTYSLGIMTQEECSTTLKTAPPDV
jgi:hypothetical protein